MIWDESLLPEGYYIAVFTDGYAVARQSAWEECQLFTSVCHRKEMAISDFVLNQPWFQSWSSMGGYSLINGKVVNTLGYYNRRLHEAVFGSAKSMREMFSDAFKEAG